MHYINNLCLTTNNIAAVLETKTYDITRSPSEEKSSGISSEATQLFLGHKFYAIISLCEAKIFLNLSNKFIGIFYAANF